jgi:hypothetical protein
MGQRGRDLLKILEIFDIRARIFILDITRENK